MKAYQDGNGVWTIAYGHTSNVHPGDTCTQEQADAYLAGDLHQAEWAVNTFVKIPLNQNQFDALVSFQFNTGALAHSSTLPLLNEGKYTEAADHLLLYNKASGKVLAGLIRRRKAEHELFMSPATTLPDTPKKPTSELPTRSWNVVFDYYWNLILNIFKRK